MAATSRLWVYHGAASGTTTDVTGATVKHKRADNSTDDLNNPVPIPSSGTNYAWPKHMKIAWTTSPNSQISNLRWYHAARPTTGDAATEWAGITMWAGTTPGYSQAVSGDEAGLRTGITTATDDYTSGSPLTITGGVVLSNPSTGVGTQDFLLVQMSVNDTAVSGNKASRSAFYRFDEI